MNRYPREGVDAGDSEFLDLLMNRVSQKSNLEMLTRWYKPSEILVHSPWREGFMLKIIDFLDVMSSDEISEIESWSMANFLSDPSTVSAHDRLEEMLSEP
jgi:hypothetical protein